jgi:hypothetical protein
MQVFYEIGIEWKLTMKEALVTDVEAYQAARRERIEGTLNFSNR